MISWRSIIRFLSYIMLFIALVMMVPLAIAWRCGEGEALQAFVMTIGAMLVTSIACLSVTHSEDEMQIGTKESMLIVSLTWVVMASFGALPLYLTSSLPSYSMCFFEIMSGFTTAGASVLTDVDALDLSVAFWRSLTNWLGGMGVVVLFVAVLPFFGVRGNALVGAEAVGPSKSKLTPTIRGTALALWMIYIGLSALQVILLMLGGLPLFDAMTLMFGTIGAAGFTAHNNSLVYYNSPYVDWICAIFMFLSGINFSLYFHALRGRFSKIKANGELRLYCLIMMVASLLVAVQLMVSGVYTAFPDSLRESVFHVVSMMTTTGFVSADFNAWPMFSQMLLLAVCFVGACSGSAGGGMKVVRIGVMLRLARNSMLKRVHPNMVGSLQMGGEHLDDKAALSIAGYVGCYFATLFLGAIVIALTGQDFLTCLMSVFLCLGNLGTGMGGLGVYFAFDIFPDWSLWVFSFLMLVGRLEFYTVYTLFARDFWMR